VTRLVWTAEAVSDVESIRDLITRSSPHYGNVVAARLVESLARMHDLPNSGRIVPELEREDIREVIHGIYRLVYKIREEGDVVEVLTVF
jgi:toxin ParE1/3/4